MFEKTSKEKQTSESLKLVLKMRQEKRKNEVTLSMKLKEEKK